MKKVIVLAIAMMSAAINAAKVDTASVSDNAVKYGATLVARHEGFQPRAYKCPAGKRTIGWGFTSKSMTSKGVITQAEADAELIRICSNTVSKLRVMHPGLKDTQYAALCSFIYNLGWGNYNSSTLKKKIEAGDYDGAKAEFLKWNKARVGCKLEVLPGLTRRRTQEADVFGW